MIQVSCSDACQSTVADGRATDSNTAVFGGEQRMYTELSNKVSLQNCTRAGKYYEYCFVIDKPYFFSSSSYDVAIAFPRTCCTCTYILHSTVVDYRYTKYAADAHCSQVRHDTLRTNHRYGRQTGACPQIAYLRAHKGTSRRKQGASKGKQA